MQKLRTYFEHVGFSGPGLDAIMSAFIFREFRKSELLVEEGLVAKYIGFVESGMFQYFAFVNDEERTTYISIENTFVASLLSFIRQKPALENIRALVDSSAWVISRAELKRLVAEVPGFKDFYIALLEGAICGIDATRHDLIALTGEQRYEKMLREEPHLLQQIPLQYLASMLGVTPRHLSRIRGNIR